PPGPDRAIGSRRSRGWPIQRGRPAPSRRRTPPMATLPHETAAPIERRLLLIDFDWQDADLIPDLFQRPGVSVRLVAGDGPQDPGVRIAELCGLPRTVDLAALPREVFALAPAGERSPPRPQP